MKTLLLALVLMLTSASSHARYVETDACGKYEKTSGDKQYFYLYSARHLNNGRYELFAASRFAATMLSTLKNDRNYCLLVGIETTRMEEGLSLIKILSR